jgi:regulator of sigma E protease
VYKRQVKTWNDAMPLLAIAAMDKREITVDVRNASGKQYTRQLQLNRLDANFDPNKLLQAIGFTSYFTNPSSIIGMVQTDGPSHQLLLVGDRITRINTTPVDSFQQIPEILAQQAKVGENLRIEIDRNGNPLQLSIAPKQVLNEGNLQWRLGIGSIPATQIVQYGALEALPIAIHKTFTMVSDSLSIIRRLLTGSASVKNLSGPISIAQAADHQAAWGLGAFLSFLAAISLALCIMNLLPIPMLDGGHLFYLTVEGFTGKPVSESFQAIGQTIGLVLLFGLFGIAIFNDFFRIIS